MGSSARLSVPIAIQNNVASPGLNQETKVLNVTTNNVCGGATKNLKEFPIGQVSVTYKVSYKFFNRFNPLPYGYFPLNVGGRFSSTSMAEGKYGVKVEVLSVGQLSNSSALSAYEQKLSEGWEYTEKAGGIQPFSEWAGTFSSIAGKVLQAYNDYGAKDDIKNALIFDQTPLVFTKEFGELHQKISTMEQKIGRSYSTTLTSSLYASATPGVATITKDLGKTTTTADKFLSNFSVATYLLDEENPGPRIDEIGTFCDTYAIADGAGGQIRIHAEADGPAVRQKSLGLAEKCRAENAGIRNLMNYTPANWSVLRSQVDIMNQQMQRDQQQMFASRIMGASRGPFASWFGRGITAGATTNIGETSVTVAAYIPYINYGACQYDIYGGFSAQLGDGSDGKPIIQSVYCQFESKYVTVQNAAVQGFQLATNLVEFVGRQLFDKSKTNAQKQAETAEAVTTAVTNGVITPRQGDAILATSNSVATNFTTTPAQIIKDNIEGTDPNQRTPGGIGAPGANTNGQILNDVPVINGGIIGAAADTINQNQTVLPNKNPGGFTDNAITTTNVVPPALFPQHTPTPSPDAINSNVVETNLVINASSSNTIATTNTVVAYNPSDGTATNTTVVPGLKIPSIPNVPTNNLDEPSTNSYSIIPQVPLTQNVIIVVPENNVGTTPTFNGLGERVTSPSSTANGQQMNLTNGENGVAAPGTSNFLTSPSATVPNYFGPGPDAAHIRPGGFTSDALNTFQQNQMQGNGNVIFMEEDN